MAKLERTKEKYRSKRNMGWGAENGWFVPSPRDRETPHTKHLHTLSFFSTIFDEKYRTEKKLLFFRKKAQTNSRCYRLNSHTDQLNTDERRKNKIKREKIVREI